MLVYPPSLSHEVSTTQPRASVPRRPPATCDAPMGAATRKWTLFIIGRLDDPL